MLKPQVEIEHFRVRVRGPRETVERIADRLMSADYPYSTDGSLMGAKYAEFIVTFDGITEAQWFAGVASDELLGEALAEPDVE
ncbi:hypothetical protein Ocepr_1047 [Oceanithermus profundus DSM 14977]|uniref:Uncharacterized protein n=2 Tax=Oceanithermus TaxID=208447 RepID=E4U7Q5_OCEP5|nr:hypothetical protein Ocepr_1047 [Oceanithermus profundus DSM 14977]GEM89385.1 hypothetical protein ODE01S_08190 [Oceanithermus desulfurans NBRC 100063]